MAEQIAIGNVVHYVAEYEWPEPAPIHLAAIVTQIDTDGVLRLHVFDEDGSGGRGRSADHDEAGAPGTWHHPEPS
jgi:hypothetical protein